MEILWRCFYCCTIQGVHLDKKDVPIVMEGRLALAVLIVCFWNTPQKGKLKLIIAFVFLFILIGTIIPKETRNLTSQNVSTNLNRMTDSSHPFLADMAPKYGHLLFFTFLGGMLCLLNRPRTFSFNIPILLMLAGGTELTQLYIDGRSPLVNAFMINAAGGSLGVLLVFISTVLNRKKSGFEFKPWIG